MKKNKKKNFSRQNLTAMTFRILWNQELVSVIAFFALALFAFWPLLVLVPTLVQGSFDRMIEINRVLLDNILFPMVAWLSALALTAALFQTWHKNRSALYVFRDNPVFVVFLALVLWMIIDIPFTNGVTNILLEGAGLKHESFFLHLEYFLCFFTLGLCLRNPVLKLWLLRGMAIISAVLASCAFYLHDHLQSSPYYYDWKPTYAGIFTYINYYGYFLNIFIALLAGLLAEATSNRWRGFYAAALALNTLALSYNDTLGAWIGSFCACVFVVAACRIRDGRFRLWSFAPLAVFLAVMCVAGQVNGNLAKNLGRFARDTAVVVTSPDSPQAAGAGSGRWFIWKNCMKLILENPVFGIGFEGVHVRVLAEVGNPRPHNEFMQYALFYGFPGLLLYVLGCVGVYVRALRQRARLDAPTFAALTAAFGYLAGSFFGLTVYNTAPYFFIMLGLGYLWVESEEKPDSVEKKKRLKRRLSL